MLLAGMTASAQVNRTIQGLLDIVDAVTSTTTPTYDKDSETVQISVRHPGDLNQKLTLNDRRYVTKLIVDGVLNDADFAVLSALAKRSKMVNSNNKEVIAYIDIDLSGAQYQNGDRVTSNLPKNAFSNSGNLRSIVLPRQINEIAEGAFQSCSALQSVTMPEGVKSIGAYAFNGTALRSVSLPASVELIGNSAFGYTKIEDAYIGANVRSCPINAFNNNNLMNINVEKGNKIYSSRDGVLCSLDGTKILNYPRGRQGSYEIPEGVTTFDANVFSANTRLTAIKLPESLTELPQGAFQECNALAQVNIPSRIQLIPKNAFRGCKALLDFTIPDNVLYIGADAFRACKGMRSVTLPRNLKTIEEYAFEYCERLINVEIPASVVSIGTKAFYHCDAMVQLTFTAPVPPAMEKINDNPKKLVIKVPQGSQAAYSAIAGFKKHKVTE